MHSVQDIGDKLMPYISVTELTRVAREVLISCSVPEKDASLVADTIVDAHCCGKGTHGLPRLPIYVRKIRDGLMDPATSITSVKESPVISIIDAHHGFGQVAAAKAINISVEKAKKYGIGVVGVRHSNNFGTAGYFVRLATESNMMGVVLGNSAPAIAPTGGIRPLLGTNPLAIGFPPGTEGIPIIIDMATSVSARGKIRLAAKMGQSIPSGWALDSEGKPTNDPFEALKGSMVPIGEYKGYALALAVDILAGMLPGAAFAGKVSPLNHPDSLSNYGHFVISMDLNFFLKQGKSPAFTKPAQNNHLLSVIYLFLK